MTQPAATTEPTEADFRTLADMISQLAWIADGQGTIVWYNQRWYDYTGQQPAAMLGWGWRSVHHPHHVDRVVEGLKGAFAAGTPWEDTFPLRSATGAYSWFLSRARPLLGAAGQVARWFGTNTDISDQRDREHELKRTTQRLEALLDATGSIVWTTDPQGRMAGPQPGLSAFTGQDEAACRGRGWLASVHPADAGLTARAWDHAVQTAGRYAVEHRLRRADGQYRTMSVHGVPVLDPQGAVLEWVGSHTDITERRRLADDLTSALEAAEAANRAKSQFLANMSHELRTPLSAVIGYSEMLQEEMEDAGQAHLLTDLDKINVNARHLLSLINDVLDLSKIEANRMTVFVEAFDVAELLAEVAGTVDNLVTRNRNTIAVEAALDTGWMHTDQVKLRQCLFNLISNAAKFTEDGTITLTAWRESHPDGPRILFAVQDSGIGMSEEELARLFSRFAQADPSTTRRFGGTGLGLAITRGLVILLGGEVDVASAVGVGTTFTLSLPAELADQKQAATAPPVGAADPHTGRGGILLIDDDAAQRELISRSLTREGYVLRSAEDGRAGLALARTLRPQVILLDVMMPQMDGWAVLQALKADAELADTPVIMTTFVNDPQLGFSLGAADYLTKPIDWAQLKTALERLKLGDAGGDVLVVDDDPGTRERLQTVLGRAGWTVRVAADGKEGLRALEASIPQLILLDLMMPGLDGFTVLNVLRSRPDGRDVPVIILTAKDLTTDDRRRLAGANLVLIKGETSLHDLIAKIRELAPAHATVD